MAFDGRLSSQVTRLGNLSGASDNALGNPPISSAHTDRLSSPLLQDLLREEKASRLAQKQAARSRRESNEHDPLDRREIQSSPLAPRQLTGTSHNHNRRSSGITKSNIGVKDMGLRETEEYVSKLNKENFDLKLELYHYRKRIDAWEAKNQKCEELETQNQELLSINESLLQELEKRNAAVQEAVAIICELEAKLEGTNTGSTNPMSTVASPEDTELGRGRSPTQRQRDPTTQLNSKGNAEALNHRPITPVEQPKAQSGIPPPFSHMQALSPGKSPSFLRDSRVSANALRDLYGNGDKSLNTNPSIPSLRRPTSILSQDEYVETLDEDDLSLNPKRLSLLSLSSFLSVYGKPKDTSPSPDRPERVGEITNEESLSFSQRMSPQESRIKQWVDSSAQPSTPTKNSAKFGKDNTFSSIGEVLHEAQPKLQETRSISRSQHRHSKSSQTKEKHSPRKLSNVPPLAGPIFGQDNLPPTPGTMSTTTLQGKASDQSIVTERSRMDVTRIPPKGYASLLPEVRPQVSDHGSNSSYLAAPPTFDSNTDIETSDDESKPVQIERKANGAKPDLDDFSQGAVALVKESITANSPHRLDNLKRPSKLPYGTDMMFNGEDIWTIDPFQSPSLHSPSLDSRRRSIQGPPELHDQQPKLPKEQGGKMQERPTLNKQGTIDDLVYPFPRQEATMKWLMNAADGAGVLGPAIEKNLPRTSSARRDDPSVSQPATSRGISQNFATRIFRRNPSQTSQLGSSALSQKSRPSNLYRQSNSTQTASEECTQPPRLTRPGTSGELPDRPSNIRRLSAVSFAADPKLADGVPKARPQQVNEEPPQQGKRLSVGAIGRSASLRIKEGLARKK
ncbi:MAG: hypothetical protein Q9167_008080 [Letrouitia subvulpina]